jgi:tripartite-type tricarboxylate transporter receptor subunit TctC
LPLTLRQALRRYLVAVASAIVLAAIAGAAPTLPGIGEARAQSPSGPWPQKTLRLISPFNPGGAIDVLNRVLAEKLAERLGQPVVVDAIPGANTIKGAEALAHAAPDGYTFMITTMSTTVNNVVLYPKLPYDPGKDFAPITQLSMGSVLLVAGKEAPFDDAKGFIAWAKGRVHPVTYGSWGVGSSGHLYGEVLKRDHGLDLSHVPYKGEIPAIVDVINQSLDVTFASPVGAKPQIAAGKIKAIGMTGPHRSIAMPDVPTFAEQGVSGMDLAVWVGVYAPAGTSRPVIERLNQELATIVRIPEVAQKMIDQGQTPIVNTPEEFARAYGADFPKWEALIKASGAKAE